MSTWQTPTHRSSSVNAATIVLVALHAGLVLLTLLGVAGLLLTEADPHGQCRIHGLDCGREARISEAVWTGVLGSAVLIILDLLLTRLLAKRRPASFVVPFLCCVGQLIVLGAVFFGYGTA